MSLFKGHTQTFVNVSEEKAFRYPPSGFQHCHTGRTQSRCEKQFDNLFFTVLGQVAACKRYMTYMALALKEYVSNI